MSLISLTDRDRFVNRRLGVSTDVHSMLLTFGPSVVDEKCPVFSVEISEQQKMVETDQITSCG